MTLQQKDLTDPEAKEHSKTIENRLRPLRYWLDHGDVVEIAVNRPGEVHVEWANGRWTKETAGAVKDLQLTHLMHLTNALAHRERVRVDGGLPILRVGLPGGHRFTAIFGPNVPETGVAITIRRRRYVSLSLGDYEASERSQVRVLEAVREGRPVLISGGTNTGKTTLLNALMNEVPLSERILVVEDVRELFPPHGNFVPLVVSTTGTDNEVGWHHCIDLATRMRPDRVMAGEGNLEGAYAQLKLMLTGHAGVGTTIHANDPLTALETWAHNVEMARGTNAATAMRRLALVLQEGLIVQLGREQGGRRVLRRVATPEELGLKELVTQGLVGYAG